jgi:hypothetical protein
MKDEVKEMKGKVNGIEETMKQMQEVHKENFN